MMNLSIKQKKGYTFDKLYAWDSLDELKRYVLTEKVTHTSQEDDAMWQFVACYTYLGFAINSKYKSKWIIVNDGTVDSGMYGIDKLMKEDETMHLVPRDIIITIILKRLDTSIQEHIEDFVNFNSSDYDWIDELEEDEQA